MNQEQMNQENIVRVDQADIVGAIDRAEVDIQISTAKAYPRNITESLNKIATYATMDPDTAADCFYVLRRRNARGEETVIEGLSVRMAEIIAGAWGNLRVQTMIVGNDGKTITARAVCHDLETNFAVAKDVKRRITDRNGRPFSEDMQVVTGNAAASIAFRNAVLCVVPKAVTKRIVEEVKRVAMGQSLDLEQSRQNALAYFARLGVTADMVFAYFGVKSEAELDKEKIFELQGLKNAIKEGSTNVYETFVKPMEDAKKEAEAKAAADTAKGKAAAAMAASASGAPAPQSPAADPAQSPARRQGRRAPGVSIPGRGPAAPAPAGAEAPAPAPEPVPAPAPDAAYREDIDGFLRN